MLQPDLFLSYGLSSALTLAAGKKLLEREEGPWKNKYFIITILWLAILFVPQVLYLLWKFPAWESMFVVKELSDIPGWFVVLYSIVVIICGALGFHITYIFLKKQNVIGAFAQVVWSGALGLFIIIFGWDGTGYKRLLYSGTGTDWANGVTYPIADFLNGPVFATLLWLEAIVLIPYACLMIKWIIEAQKQPAQV